MASGLFEFRLNSASFAANEMMATQAYSNTGGIVPLIASSAFDVVFRERSFIIIMGCKPALSRNAFYNLFHYTATETACTGPIRTTKYVQLAKTRQLQTNESKIAGLCPVTAVAVSRKPIIFEHGEDQILPGFIRLPDLVHICFCVGD